METVVKIENLSKYYRLGLIGSTTLREDVNRFFDSLRGKPDPILTPNHGRHVERKDGEIWALRNINLEANSGDLIGIIGHNGAGKSTLLKILSKITAPTQGVIKLKGRIGSLLEVGTGFHPELTGKENIYLNGAILGMTRPEITRKLEEIIDFSQVEKFIDTPIKRYSSGMIVRLAFSVAAHLDPEILIIDEVLAVGDQRFQEKCLGKLSDISSQGRTIFFVSHNLSSVSKLCGRAIVMKKGEIIYDGTVEEGISIYSSREFGEQIFSEKDYIGELFPSIQFDELKFNDQSFVEGSEYNPLNKINIELKGKSEVDMQGYKSIFSVRKNNQLIFSLYDSETFSPLKKGKFLSRFKIPEKFLLPGIYTCSIGGIGDGAQWLWTRDYRFLIEHRWHQSYDTTSTVLGVVNIDAAGERIQ